MTDMNGSQNKVLSFPEIGLYYNSSYNKTIWCKIHLFF